MFPAVKDVKVTGFALVRHLNAHSGCFDTWRTFADDGPMATQTIVQITDDLDNSPNAESVTFAYGSDTWSLDLSKKNRTQLEKLLKPYMDAGRKVSNRGVRKATASSKPNRAVDLAAIRTWARENGHEVSDRGRIAAPIVEAYEAAR